MKPAEKISAPWLSATGTQAVFEAVERGGFTARAVGGIVRNTLLGLPATDIDIATDAPPEATMKLAKASGLKTIPTGLAHGTITVIAHGIPCEVTTLRRDVSTDGRHADVAFTNDWAADAARRDFTINALYCDRHGTVFDPLGGIADLSPLKVRFIGDPTARITEDYLRILRFFRFSATFCADGRLDKTGLAAASALSGGLSRISGERIQSELLKLLAAPYAVSATHPLVRSGVFGALCHAKPNLAAFTKLTAIETALQRPPDPVLRLAALAITDPSDAQELVERLKLSTRDRQIMNAAAECSGSISPQKSVPSAKVALYTMGVAAYMNTVLLAWARDEAPVNDKAFHALATLPATWQPPVFPISGADVIAAGAKPGPSLGKILSDLEFHWIENGFSSSRDQLLAFLKSRLRGEPPASDTSADTS